MAESSLVIRRAKPEDAAVCGQICYEAFHKISSDHNFPSDVPDPAHGVRLISQVFSHPGFYCVVGEVDGAIVGSNCIDERGPIAGIGPVTIDPNAQNSGIGRQLMIAVLDRAQQRGLAGVRLVQAAFHNRSLSLYTTLGFDVREPLAVMNGRAHRSFEGFTVRKAGPRDVEDCNRVAVAVHGFHRGGELADAIRQGTAMVVERGGRITGYASSLAFSGHAVAETNPDLQAIIAASDGFGGPGILVPSRNAELFRWCLANGLRVVQPMTLMSLGLYNEPKGAFLPSILY